MCSSIYDQTFKIFFFDFLCVFGFLHTQKQKHESKKRTTTTTKTMHIKRCMMHICMTIKHLMRKGSYKYRKN